MALGLAERDRGGVLVGREVDRDRRDRLALGLRRAQHADEDHVRARLRRDELALSSATTIVAAARPSRCDITIVGGELASSYRDWHLTGEGQRGAIYSPGS